MTQFTLINNVTQDIVEAFLDDNGTVYINDAFALDYVGPNYQDQFRLLSRLQEDLEHGSDTFVTVDDFLANVEAADPEHMESAKAWIDNFVLPGSLLTGNTYLDWRNGGAVYRIDRFVLPVAKQAA